MHRVRGLHHRLAERRVRVNGSTELPGRDLHQHRWYRLGDEIGRMRADNMHTEHLIALRIRENFYETLGLIHRHRFSERGKREFADDIIHPLALKLLFALPDRTDLGRCEDTSRRDGTRKRNGFAAQSVHHIFCGSARPVCEHDLADRIADRKDVRSARTKRLVNLDESPVIDPHPRCREIQIRRNGLAPD